MLIFEYESGNLYATRLGTESSDGVDPEVMAAVRDSVLEIVGRPLFPILWSGSEGTHAGREEPHRLVAMDPSGQVVSVEVVGALDSISLVAALARSGRTASLGWVDLAEMYPHGAAEFRRDWNEFRQSLPPRPIPGPRLYVVAGSISDDVRPALEVLADSGVEAFEVTQRRTAQGRIIVEITEPFRITVPTISTMTALRAGHRPDLVASGDSDLQRQVAPASEAPAALTVPSPPPAAPSFSAASPAPAVVPAPAPEPAAVTSNPELRAIAAELGGSSPLLWVQLRRGIRLEALLRLDGTIELPDGRRFNDPSEAAQAAALRPDVDGWHVWRFGPEGPSLADAATELGLGTF